MINIELAGIGQHKRSNEPHREITNEMICAHSKDSDQPGHPPSLIRVFTVRLKIDRILAIHEVHSEDSDQTGHSPRLI